MKFWQITDILMITLCAMILFSFGCAHGTLSRENVKIDGGGRINRM